MTQNNQQFSVGVVRLIILIYLSIFSISYAGCINPVPRATPYAKPSGSSCPNGYSERGDSCVPSNSSSGYAYANPGGAGCPRNYNNYSQSCYATNNDACHAYFSGGASCPSGYTNYGNSCISQ